MKNTIAAIVLATLASTSIAEANMSPNLDSKQVVDLALVETTVSIHNLQLMPFDGNLGLSKTTTPNMEKPLFQIAWSIKGAAKKIGRGAKKVGKTAKKAAVKTGRGIKKANRIIVPSEIRNAASKAKRGVVKAGRYVAKHPYGKRCKPNKYLQPVCTVKGKRTRQSRDHRSN